MTVVLTGISHHRAPLALRELVAVSPEGARELAQRLAADGEAVCLSTCNRTELYLAHDDAALAEARAVRALARLAGLSEAELTSFCYRLHDHAAALHLFRVSAGLDSMVPGEAEILGQVRTAYEVGAAGRVLARLFGQALRSGKRVRSQTAIGENPASVSSVAAALVEQVFDDLRGSRVLLIGAGKAGQLTARSLAARGATIGLVASRKVERARSLARRFGGEGVALADIEEALGAVDVVVSATSSPGILLSKDQVERVLGARKGRPLFLIDIAVPRDLDPAIHELDGCYLYNIDDLRSVVEASLASRRREAVKGEALVAEEAERFRAWHASLDVVPAIASLRARAEEIRRGELAKAQGRLGELSDSERRAVESVTAQIVNKLLHLPTVRMKEAAAAADGPLYVDTVRDLFGLGDDGSPRRIER